VDHNDFVWIGTYMHHRVQKFTREGKLLLTIGQYDKNAGSNDTTLLGGPAGIWVDPKSNEVFIADGYRNRRVIVFDGSTGAYRRHWGAYGNRPDDTEKFDPKTMTGGALPKQFSTVHGLTGSKDGKIFVADRRGNRIQVFDQQGKFLSEKIIAPATLSSGSAFVIVLSPDPQQQWVYLADGTNHKGVDPAPVRHGSRRRVRPRRPADRAVPPPARHERGLEGEPLRWRGVHGAKGAAVRAREVKRQKAQGRRQKAEGFALCLVPCAFCLSQAIRTSAAPRGFAK
jgi:hypothetical protein